MIETSRASVLAAESRRRATRPRNRERRRPASLLYICLVYVIGPFPNGHVSTSVLLPSLNE